MKEEKRAKKMENEEMKTVAGNVNGVAAAASEN